MKRISIILVFVSFTLNLSFGQGVLSYSKDELKNKMEETFQELYSIIGAESFSIDTLNIFCTFQSQRKDYSFDKKVVFERLLENGQSQKYIEIRNVIDFYYLNVILSNGEVNNLKFYSEDSIFVEKKNNEVELPLTVYEYGDFCGIGGVPPEKCKEMLSLVSERNYKILSKWLNSLNPEISVYGYFGLWILKMRGVEIGEFELNRMEILRNSDIKIYTCEGCLYGEMKTIKDVVEETKLKNSYNSFRKYNWLK